MAPAIDTDCAGCVVCDPVEAAREALGDARDHLSDLTSDLFAAEERVAAIRRLLVPARARVVRTETALRLAREGKHPVAEPKHTRNGKADGPWPYGTTHDMDCPACVASGSSFTASPRSETYWSS